MKRGRLSQGKTVKLEDAPDARPSLAADDPVVVEEPSKAGAAVGGFLRGLIGLLLLLAFILGGTYLAIAGTVATPLKSADDYVLVMRNAYPLGGAPTDSMVFIQAQPVTGDLVTQFQQAVLGVDDGGVVQVIAAPGGIVAQVEDGTIAVNGVPTEYRGKVDPVLLNKKFPGLMDEKYLALCVSGVCGTPGSVVVIPQDFVVGEARGIITTSGLTTIERPAPAAPATTPAPTDNPAEQ